MNSINIKERQMLQEWASVHSDENIFDRRCKVDENSYFVSRNREDTYIMKYKFETIAQLQENIKRICGDEIDLQTQKLLAIAAFKCKASQVEDTHEANAKNNVDRGKLPEFTYAF
ncbi:MAG: hypothetical protein K2K56_10150 [Lachnospiraceae bacterium]|nr:hypothetical protein [Lachnospiraceae bacterium]